MKVGFIGLGKMGFNMVERLLEKGHHVTAYNKDPGPVAAIARRGALPADSVRALVASLAAPRVVWIMVPYQAVSDVLNELVPLLEKGDTVIDGGNSPYKESVKRSVELEARGLHFLDAGVSGGPSGARTGACIMVGGREEVFRKQERLFRDLSIESGYAYIGGPGAGHFVKMVHNGIEYGMMQALAEGFSVMQASAYRPELARIAELFNHRSVIESRLVGWLKNAFTAYGNDLGAISGSAEESGEGAWTVDAAKELGVPVPIISGAHEFRVRSRKKPSYTGRIISALRHEFGGHEMSKQKERVTTDERG